MYGACKWTPPLAASNFFGIYVICMSPSKDHTAVAACIDNDQAQLHMHVHTRISLLLISISLTRPRVALRYSL